MANMEPRIERALRDWWSNHCEQDTLKTDEARIEKRKRELVAEAEVLVSRLDEFTENYTRHLMLNVYEDYFVVLVWNPDYDSHTIEIMRNEYGK